MTVAPTYTAAVGLRASLHDYEDSTGAAGVLRLRNPSCRRCSLRVKTEKRPVELWNDADLVAQVKVLLPEGKRVHVRGR